MKPINRFLFFFLLPIVGVLSYPPAILLPGLPVIVFAILLFAGLGWLLWRGRSLALTFSIFLQGLNVIIRLLMLFPSTTTTSGQVDWAYLAFHVFGLALSFYLMLRLDQVDVRVQMVT